MTEIDDLDERDHPWRFSSKFGWIVLLNYRRNLHARVISSRAWEDLGDLPSGGDALPFLTSCRSHLRNLERFNREKFDYEVAYLKERIAQFELLKDGLIQTHSEREACEEAEAKRQQAEVEVRRGEVDAIRNVWGSVRAVIRYACQPCPALDETDWLLVRDWASRSRGADDVRMNSMASARQAELAALNIYHDLHGHAEDLSILQQVRPSDSRWKSADLFANGRWVDVKNARCSSTWNSYSEHTVKKFKLSDLGDQIVISGFLSPYLPSNRASTLHEPLVWLGETSWAQIEQLRDEFDSSYLRLDFKRGEASGSTRTPPWLFEYPAECYENRSLALDRARSRRSTISAADLPWSFFILVGEGRVSQAEDAIVREVVSLRERFPPGTLPVRPRLFLHILDRFCQSVSNGQQFPADVIRAIVFARDSRLLAGCASDRTPFAMWDPRETISELLTVPQAISSCCADRAAEFTTFRLSGAGVLEGWRKGSSPRTIYAYCGGRRGLEGGSSVKCGQTPLFMGQNESCEECGKLRCHVCHYCSNRCSGRVRETDG